MSAAPAHAVIPPSGRERPRAVATVGDRHATGSEWAAPEIAERPELEARGGL